MLTLFNRRELITVLDSQRLFRLRNALADAGIPSAVRTAGQFSMNFNRGRGTPGVNQDRLYQYTVYVHKKDHARAFAAIQAVPRDQ